MTNTDDTTPARPHTPEPWEQDNNDFFAVTADNDGLLVAETEIHDRTDEECYANARRIVAAVNTCEGIATSALEQGVVADLLEALQAFVAADALAEECGEWKWENLEHAFALARSAIALAKGGAQ